MKSRYTTERQRHREWETSAGAVQWLGVPFFLLAGVLVQILSPGHAQNVVDDAAAVGTAERRTVAAAELQTVVNNTPHHSARPSGREAARIAVKLDSHVAELIAGFPYLPFHNTLGISGYEAYFDHPDHLFYALSIALPYLTPPTARQTRRFLSAQLSRTPPHAVPGFDNKSGRPRESYHVPPDLRVTGTREAGSAFGVYVLWSYCHQAGDTTAAMGHWAAVKSRMRPLLEKEYPFQIERNDYSNDEAQKLNGDLAGLIGFIRLARMNRDGAAEAAGQQRALQLLSLRVNLERVNPRILEKTNSSSKRLHINKLARYCDLVPEVGEVVRSLSDGLGAARLKAFREPRNGWYLAFGERLIGGENYTNPPHLSRALFAGGAVVEPLPANQLLSFVDVPWCRGDLYFIEKCALALWAAGGRRWTEIR